MPLRESACLLFLAFLYSLAGLAAPPSGDTLEDIASIDFDRLRNPRRQAPLHPLMIPSVMATVAGDSVSSDHFHPRDRPMLHDSEVYQLHLQADPTNASLRGKLIYTFSARSELSELQLDAFAMSISAVQDRAGQSLDYSYDGRLLTIRLPAALNKGEQGSVAIHYAATRSQSFLATGPDATSPQRMPAAYTFTQPEGSQTWFPCVDTPADKALLDLNIEVAAPHRVLSNGALLFSTHAAGINRFHYRMNEPIAPYLVSLAIGPYAVLSLGQYQGKALSLWTPPAIAEAARLETAATAKMMAVFSDFTGTPYPFASYATSVASAWTTSMEHQSATTMGGWRISGDGSGVGVVAHELAHQWFGDWVTCERWSELWLNEGFATYLPGIYFAASGQRHEMLAYEDYWRFGYLREAQTKIRALSSPSADWADLFDAHSYEKGALVLKLLQATADDLPSLTAGKTQGLFNKALRQYLAKHGRGSVRNFDLQHALEQATDRSWQVFFDEWVRSPGHPKLRVQWQAQGRELNIETEQTQDPQAGYLASYSFPLYLEVLGEAADERQVIKLAAYGKQQQWLLTLPFVPRAINLDPEWLVPFAWDLQGSASVVQDNFYRVWQHSPSERSRLYAMRQILESRREKVPAAMIALIKRDPSFYLQADALSHLTALAANRDAVQELTEHLQARAGEPDWSRLVGDVVALSQAWLVSHAPQAPSTADEAAWQAAYFEAPSVTARSALLNQLRHASLPRAQAFALARLSEARWVTRDRAALLDLLTKAPLSDASWQFLEPALTQGVSYLWFKRVVDSLVRQEVDDQRLVAPLAQQASSYRYLGGRLAAVQLLSRQKSSASLVCPILSELAHKPAGVPDSDLRLRESAREGLRELACPP